MITGSKIEASCSVRYVGDRRLKNTAFLCRHDVMRVALYVHYSLYVILKCQLLQSFTLIVCSTWSCCTWSQFCCPTVNGVSDYSSVWMFAGHF